jgi:hypothetical protein
VNGAKQHNRFQHEVDGAYDSGCDVVVQAAVWAGEDVELFAKIDDVRREGRKSDKKDNEKKCFPFMKRSRSSHERFSSRIFGKGSRIKSLVKILFIIGGYQGK